MDPIGRRGLNWNELVGKHGSYVAFSASLTEIPDESDLAEFWDHICNTTLPRHGRDDWDSIRIEFWLDSGRIIAFPQDSTMTKRIDRAVSQIISTDLEHLAADLHDEGAPDGEYEAALREIESRLSETIVKVAHRASSSARIPPGRRCIRCHSGGYEQPFAVITF